MKTLKQINVSGKRVIVRVDFNVPIEKGRIQDDYRIRASIPTIQYLLKKKAAVIVIAHLGRPNGKPQKNLSLAPVAKALARMVQRTVLFAKTLEEAGDISKFLKSGAILMLENIRFYDGEIKNYSSFAKRLASFGDWYVNDAFGDAHRAHASIVGIPQYLPHAAGLLLEKEVRALSRVLKNPKRPVVAIIGGAKISSKLPLIKRFVKKADAILVGGALANTILAAKHISIGKSHADTQEQISWLRLTDKKLVVPVDAVVTRSLKKDGGVFVRGIGNIKKNEYIADIGPDSVKLFRTIIQKARTIIWNGPLGFIETHPFENGTKAIARQISASRAYTVIGGGDLHRIVRSMKLDASIDHISTGGGAMLEFLSGKTLPGIEALK